MKNNLPKPIIDILGNIYLNDNMNHTIIIHKNLSLEDIKNFLLKYDVYDIKNGYLWVYLNQIKIEDFYFKINICFYQNKIWAVDICFFHQYENQFSWNTWQEKDEIKKKHQYHLWLNQIFQDKRIFDWGRIEAYYDPKGQRAGIWLSYQCQIPNGRKV